MLNIVFKTDEFARTLNEIGKQELPYATELAINATARLLKRKLQHEMPKAFDNPTRYTYNSLFIKPAKKTDLSAKVWFKDGNDKDEWASGKPGVPALNYLGPNVFGGARRLKSYERQLIAKGLMPSDKVTHFGKDAPLDRYGNLTGGKWKQIMSGLGADFERAGYQSNITKKSAKRNRRRGRYFLLGDRGIGLRQGGEVNVILWFVSQPNYKPRFDFYGISERVVNENIQIEFAKAFARAVRTHR